jgi:tRNA pseudouridine38-40 synthase
VETGRGKLSVADVASFFKGVTDVPAKLTSPPSGLFLENVYYPREEIKSDPVPVIRVF